MHVRLKMLHKLYIKNIHDCYDCYDFHLGLTIDMWYSPLSEEQLRTNLDRITRTRRDTSSMNILTVNNQNAQNSRTTTRNVQPNLVMKENGTSATYDDPKRASK